VGSEMCIRDSDNTFGQRPLTWTIQNGSQYIIIPLVLICLLSFGILFPAFMLSSLQELLLRLP
jgi:hypothetical protein